MTILLLYVLYAVFLLGLLARSGLNAEPSSLTKPDPDPPSKILIIGATGGTGRELVKQALERGYDVTAFVRDTARVKTDHPNLRVIEGDVLDAASVKKAIEGQEAVLSALGHKRFFYPNRILSDGTRNIVNAMLDIGVKRFVCETSLGIGDSAGRMGLYYTLFVVPVVLPFYFFDKTRQERIIAESILDWVIVRPGVLTNGVRRGKVRHGRKVGNYFLTVRISRADVAAFMLDQLESNKYLRATPGVSW